MGKTFISFFSDENGASIAEYALLVGLIAVGAITAITGLGTNIQTKINAIATAISK